MCRELFTIMDRGSLQAPVFPAAPPEGRQQAENCMQFPSPAS
jgi:hypothetical protein